MYHQIAEVLKGSRAEKLERAVPKEYVYGADISATNILKERRNVKELKKESRDPDWR